MSIIKMLKVINRATMFLLLAFGLITAYSMPDDITIEIPKKTLIILSIGLLYALFGR